MKTQSHRRRAAQHYYGSDQYSICNNLTLASGRDLSVLDIRGYKQVCVLGDRAGKDLLRRRGPRGQGAPAQRAEL